MSPVISCRFQSLTLFSFRAYTKTFVNDFGDAVPKVLCNYTFATRHGLSVGGRILSMRKQTYKTNNLSPGRSTLKLYSLNNSKWITKLFHACYCLLLLRKRCNYLRQCVSKYVGHNSRAWVERAAQLFLCTTVSSSDRRLHVWLHSWLWKGSGSFTARSNKHFELITRIISPLWIHQWMFLKITTSQSLMQSLWSELK